MSMKARILIVDDEAYQRDILMTIMKNEGYIVACAENGKKAIGLCARFVPEVVLCDLRLPDMEGTEVMKALRQSDQHQCEFIIFTAHGNIESAVAAIKDGAFDYLTKPVERDKLIVATRRACDHVALVRENRQLRQQLAGPLSIEGIVGKHPAILKVFDFIKVVAPLAVTVLITGETGTGKELVARAIHACSPRKSKILQTINCASMPEALLESELFGYEKGAFTGAFSQKRGLIEVSHGGTLFLDEIGELPIGPQAKLLRFLEEKKIRRIGGTEEIAIDVRLIAATNKKLSDEITKGRFREDLFYRFRGFVIELPPLREHASDIIMLAQHFVERHSLIFNKKVKRIDNNVFKILMSYEWPGNVRQLDSVVEKAVLLADGDTIRPTDIEIPQGAQPETFKLPSNGMCLADIERQIIAKAMERADGSVARAAQLLGTTYRTMEYRVKKFGIAKIDKPNGESDQPKR